MRQTPHGALVLAKEKQLKTSEKENKKVEKKLLTNKRSYDIVNELSLRKQQQNKEP